MEVVGNPLRLSATPARPPGPAPVLDQRTDAVLERWLGVSVAQRQALRAGGVIGARPANGDLDGRQG